MLLNYIKLTVRLLIRNPFITLINVLGLSIGFASFYGLWRYAQSELKSDQFHHDYERIARLSWHHRWTDHQNWDEFYNASNFCGVGKRIADEFSEVIDLTRLVPQKTFNKQLQGTGESVFFVVYRSNSTKEFFREDNTVYADPNFFQFFNFPFLSGDAATALFQPGSVVISHQYSIKYFGTADPINSIIYLNDSIPLNVTGVFADLPNNTHFKFDIVISTAGMDGINSEFNSDHEPDWMGANYIKVSNGIQFTDLERKIDNRRKELYNHWKDSDPTVFVQPLKDIVFTHLIDNRFVYKSKNALIILRALSLIILLLAFTNYISLSITTLHKRMPEVGTRKVAGARNSDFIFQFFIESAIINFLSILLALTFVQLVRVPAEYLFHFRVAEWSTLVGQHLTILFLIPVAGIIVTGIYPVLISAQKSSTNLLKKLRTVQMPWWVKLMVTFQYASSVVLLIWIGTVYFQLNYILNKNTGINPNGVLVVNYPFDRDGNYNQKLDYFTNESRAIPGVFQVSLSKSVMGDDTGVPFFAQRGENGIGVGLYTNGVVDENFLELYGIHAKGGKKLSSQQPRR